ncbi:MAG TPA: methyltransferase domain-containing protein [Syntrophorhabdales bacterium]|nr:methyltransferase domain-containing protein [Syntrophorhabdales bacterium]
MTRKGTIPLVMLVLTALLYGGITYKEHEVSAKEKPELDVPYEPTSQGIAEEMLKIADVTSRDLVYDLGCGDGRIVIMAAKERGAKGVGVDMDPDRIRESRENAERAGVTNLVRFYEQNIFETNISNATVVMLYLWPEVNLKLRPKLIKELKPGTRIVSHSHTMGEWSDDATREVEGHTLHFFVVPANASGKWQWMGPEKALSFLQLTQKFQKVQGSITIGGETYPITNCSLRGNNLLFSMERNRSDAQEIISFQGSISGNTIEGRIMQGRSGRAVSRWQATRDPSTIAPIAE